MLLDLLVKPIVLNSAALAEAITGDVPTAELVHRIRGSPQQSKRLLEELARHRDPVVRAWVLGVARTVLGKDGVPLMLRLARKDRDTDVRDVAIEELLELDRDAAQSLIPLFRERLGSSDPFESLTAMWALGAIGDQASIDLIRAKISGRQPDALDRITGEVVIMMLANPSEIPRLVREHDHERMPWLSKAARLLGTVEAAGALRSCLENAPDSQCRDQCRADLERLEARAIQTP